MVVIGHVDPGVNVYPNFQGVLFYKLVAHSMSLWTSILEQRHFILDSSGFETEPMLSSLPGDKGLGSFLDVTPYDSESAG